MGTTRDFIASALADIILPMLRNSTEDAVYETLDKRQVPTRTDFKEVRDLVNSLRGQVSGTSKGIERIVARIDDLEEQITKLEENQKRVLHATKGAARVCKVPGCDQPIRSKGYCGKHYQQWRRGRLNVPDSA